MCGTAGSRENMSRKILYYIFAKHCSLRTFLYCIGFLDIRLAYCKSEAKKNLGKVVSFISS